MTQESTVPESPEQLEAWIAGAPAERNALERGGYGTAFTAADLFPLLAAMTGKNSKPLAAPSPAARPEQRRSRGAAFWTGWVISGFVGLFLLVDGGGRLARFAPYVEGLTRFGFAERLGPPLGVLLVICTFLYLVPRTALIGAVLLTGYLGGACATQLRAGDPWYLFPVAMGALAWLGLYLRDARVRAILP